MKKIYKIWNKKTEGYNGSYSRAYHDEYEFDSEESALEANCHGMFHDTDTYEIHEVEQTEKVISKLPPKKEYLEKTKKSRENDERLEKYKKEHPDLDDMQAIIRMHMGDLVNKIDIEQYYKGKDDKKA